MKLFGYNTVEVNGAKIFCINVITDAHTITVTKVSKNDFWNTRHTQYVKNGKEKLNFKFTTLCQEEFKKAKYSLDQILFVHKIQKLFRGSFIPEKIQEKLAYDTMAELREINNAPYESYMH